MKGFQVPKKVGEALEMKNVDIDWTDTEWPF